VGASLDNQMAHRLAVDAGVVSGHIEATEFEIEDRIGRGAFEADAGRKGGALWRWAGHPRSSQRRDHGRTRNGKLKPIRG
jgi:hypothetical protein